MSDLSWGGQLAVDHNDAFVHIEVPGKDGVSIVTLEPQIARRLGHALIIHAESLLAKEVVERREQRMATGRGLPGQ